MRPHLYGSNRSHVGETKQVNVRLPVELAAWLEQLRRRESKSVAYLLSRILEIEKHRREVCDQGAVMNPDWPRYYRYWDDRDYIAD